MSKNLFFLGLLISASGIISPPIALLLGLIYGFSFAHPFHVESKKLSRLLLQISVIGLGFGMDFEQILRVGRTGFLYTALGITAALLMGLGLGRILQIKKNISYLISIGTAICGGSAIAAVSPICNASEEEIAVSLGAVFLLNSIALVVFPLIGQAFHLTQTQFGLWAALAIHDTSSVVGASAKFGAIALAVGTTVKLARALWIVPVSIGAAAVSKSKTKIQWPWFIVFFCLAAAMNSYVPQLSFLYPTCKQLGIIGLTATLYLIGTGLSKNTLRSVGVRPLVQAVLLWVLVASSTLFFISRGLIHL